MKCHKCRAKMVLIRQSRKWLWHCLMCGQEKEYEPPESTTKPDEICPGLLDLADKGQSNLGGKEAEE